jgi:anti-sigma-K factor RskA
MSEHRGPPNGEPGADPREEHAWVRELLGPYVLGALDQEEEEKTVEQHLEGCAACRDEERGLRETHERLAGASMAASAAPPDLKGRVLHTLPQRGGETTPIETAREVWSASPARRVAAVAAVVVLFFALAAVTYSAGLFYRTTETAILAPTDLAPEAGGEVMVRGSGPNQEASLEVWGLPKTGPNEYYQLWLGKEEGRVSTGTFAVDEGGRGELSGLCPETVGGYQRAGITLEQFPEEPRMDSARVVLRGDLQGA